MQKRFTVIRDSLLPFLLLVLFIIALFMILERILEREMVTTVTIEKKVVSLFSSLKTAIIGKKEKFEFISYWTSPVIQLLFQKDETYEHWRSWAWEARVRLDNDNRDKPLLGSTCYGLKRLERMRFALSLIKNIPSSEPRIGGVREVSWRDVGLSQTAVEELYRRTNIEVAQSLLSVLKVPRKSRQRVECSSHDIGTVIDFSREREIVGYILTILKDPYVHVSPEAVGLTLSDLRKIAKRFPPITFARSITLGKRIEVSPPRARIYWFR